MENTNQYTTALALSVTRHHTYQRGKEYYLAGKVEIIANDRKGVSAIVEGTDEYKVVLWFDEDDEFHYACSCPVNTDRDGACKHVVATILTLSGKSEENEDIKENEVVMPELSLSQARQFIRLMIEENPGLAEELRVFLQGEVESSVSSEGYYDKYRKELARIDLDSLLESWYEYNEMGEFDDGYYDDSMDEGDSDNQLQTWVDEVFELMQRYMKNENYIEVLKIGVGAIRALSEREGELKEGMSDLSDWFASGINQLMDSMAKLGKLLTKDQLQRASTQWELLLSAKGLDDYLGPMVMALGEVLERLGDQNAWRAHIEKYVNDYPLVAISLLLHYKTTGDNIKLVELGERLLQSKKQRVYDQYFDLNNYYDQNDLIVQVRRVLDSAYEGEKKRENLEMLFLASHELEDYNKLRVMFATKEEKERFWRLMEKEWEGRYETEDLFKVYQLEGEKKRILQLIEKYPEVECFAKMVREIRSEYPEECYEAYLKKMKGLLIPTDVGGYDAVAYHLKQMQEIGLDDKFAPYLTSIKTEYKRRRRMMEALTRKGL